MAGDVQRMDENNGGQDYRAPSSKHYAETNAWSWALIGCTVSAVKCLHIREILYLYLIADVQFEAGVVSVC